MAEKPKRKDKRRMVLRKGESQRKDGSYDYRWTTRDVQRAERIFGDTEEIRKPVKKHMAKIKRALKKPHN